MTRSRAIWLIAGGAMQRPAAEIIKAMGYSLILTDGSANCVLRPLADSFVHLDTFDIAGNIARADVLTADYDICAVFTAGADCHETVASLAAHFGRHGISPKIARVCRYKNETRKLLTAAGVPQPALCEARSHAEARAAADAIGYPIALKATDNSGSRGFSRIDTAEELNDVAFQRAIENGTTGIVIVEELLVPQSGVIAEQSVETLWVDGKMRWLNWVDRLFRKDFEITGHPWTKADDPYPNISWAVELGHINPASHPSATQSAVESMVRRAGEALGMGSQMGGHILKADMMLTTKGPIILELTPRLSGGWDSALSTPQRGADFIGGALRMALNEVCDDAFVQRYFTYKNPGRIVAMLTEVRLEAQDCIGREFAWGTGMDRPTAIEKAYDALRARNFLQ